MTIPRKNQIDLHATSYYHCTTYCGCSNETGKDYRHRKEWIFSQTKRLGSIFSIKICAYAIKKNRYHLVLFVDKKSADHWDEYDIRDRWGKLFYKDAEAWNSLPDDSKLKHHKTVLWNDRLMDINWFMRCLNQTIARLSSKKGEFWEGRYKCQALLDDAAVLRAMAHVNLAKASNVSKFSSIIEGIEFAKFYLKRYALCLIQNKS